MLYDNFPRIPSQKGCCGPSVRVLQSLHSQGTQVSRKVAGWRFHIDAFEVFSGFTVQKGSDQTQLSWDNVFKHPRTCGIDRMSNQIGKINIFGEFSYLFSV